MRPAGASVTMGDTVASPMRDLDAAIDGWRALLGDANVITDPDALRAAASATYATTQRVTAIVRPRTTAEVSAVMRIATAREAPVYPISRGRNWGLGSRVPTGDGCALLDLSEMRAITAFDESLAWITVEPGVTFRQAHEFLTEHRSKLFVSVTGSSPEASLVGNAVERGDGAGPLGDRASHVCAIEAVLATGEVIRTGFARFGDVPVAPLHRWGVGPSLDGLLSQSNLAVVTRMTLWLSPLPRSIQAMRFSLRDDARLPALVDALRGLRLDGTLRATASLWNDLRALSTEARSSDADARTRFRAETGEARWFGLTGLYAPTALMGRAMREHAVATLAPIVAGWQVEERSGDPAAGRELLWEPEPALGFLQGVPHEYALKSMYWAKSFGCERSPDPDRDRCGVVWACAAVPLRGDEVLRACVTVREVFEAHGFDPMIAIATPTERVASVLPTVLYDRDREGDDDRAMRCHDALLAACAERGWLPHRLGVHSMASLPPTTDDSRAVLARLRTALDPAGVLAPGRYEK